MISEAELLKLERRDPRRAALLRVVRDLGGTDRTAKAIAKATRSSLTGQAVRLWMSRGYAPPDRAPLLSRLTDGRVSESALLGS